MSTLAVLLPLAACARPRPGLPGPAAVDRRRVLAELEGMEARRRAHPAQVERYLSDPDPRIRRRAVLAVLRLRDPALVDALRPRLRDDDPGVRAVALFAAGLLDAEGLAPAVEAALGAAHPAVRRAALLAAGRLGLPRAVPAVAGALRGPDPDLAAAAADAAFRLDRAEVVPPLVAALAAASPRVRFHAAFALARLSRVRRDLLGEPLPTPPGLAAALRRARPALVAAAGDPDPWTAAAALEALGPGAPAAAALRAARRPEPAVAVAALRVLASRGRSGALAALLARGGDPDPQVRLEALRGLGVLAGRLRREPRQRLARWARARLAREGEPYLRGGLLALLAALDPEGALPRLRAAARAPDFRLRLGAARGARHVPGAAGRALLLRLRGDAAPVVRAAALRGLAARFPGTPAVRRALEEALGAATATDPAAAAAGLAARGRPEALPLLLRALARARTTRRSSATAEGRLGLLQAVARLGGRRHRELLASWADDPAPLVRHGVARLLTALGSVVPADLPAPRLRVPSFPAPAVARPRVRVVTERGEFLVELRPDWAPLHVRAFLALVSRRFYDGKRFHRVVPNHVVQGGDPEGTGYGGLPWTLPDEPAPVPFAAGIVGLAKLGPDTASCQFFVTLAPRPHLDGDYTPFGRVVGGREVLRRLLPHDRILRMRRVRPTAYRRSNSHKSKGLALFRPKGPDSPKVSSVPIR